MEKLIRNDWLRTAGEPFERAGILEHDLHPEGLDVARIRFVAAGRFAPKAGVGHLVSVLRGSATLRLPGDARHPLHVAAGVHLYLPPGLAGGLEATPGAELLCVSGASESQSRGTKLLVRDETFVAACAAESQSLRWILTPQYLSRRIFLHHDPVLLSKSGNPVSWFRTTMFDVAGLPENEEGEPVFKMSYNSRTEVNVCYDVQGSARVRMARHPYQDVGQSWGPWRALDGDSTYHLNEAAGGPEEERRSDAATRNLHCLRNKHEVSIVDGHVTLFCLFDPAPTGVERHQPGAYSDYEPLAQVLGTRSYEIHQREIARYDEMVDRLSLAKAMGVVDTLHGTPVWQVYLQGREAQAAVESELTATLAAQRLGRDRVVSTWVQTAHDR
jgi:hypothetical protein